MKIATILFTYARPVHTQKTLEALSKNTEHPTKLYIFQDGMKRNTDVAKWNAVGDVIRSVSWCDTEIVIREKNVGLAKSIVWGINRVMVDNDAAIILEDDCVSHPQFMEYMMHCLKKYKDNQKVFSVNGSSWLAEVEKNGTDAFFMGRINSYGWATWKDRWQTYEEDYLLLKKIKNDPNHREQFEVWGQDLESHLKGNIDGICDSWAVFWALQCIWRGGFCPTPYESLITNIGFDGSGVHCGTGEIKTRVRVKDNLSELILPETVEFPKNYKKAFQDVFHYTLPEVRLNIYNQILLKWIELSQKGIRIKDYFKEHDINQISIWGRGNICNLLISELKETVHICSIIESTPTVDSYENIDVVSLEEVSEEVELIIVIPVYDYERIKRQAMRREYEVIGIDELVDVMELKS